MRTQTAVKPGSYEGSKLESGMSSIALNACCDVKGITPVRFCKLAIFSYSEQSYGAHGVHRMAA
eukprot:1032669-Heterocapsa_arctica.AAC.1